MATKNALGFKKSEYVKPVAGIATIKAGSKGKGKITFQDEEIKFSTGNNSMVISLDDLPDIPAIAPETEDDYFVKFNPDTDEIFYIGPVQTTLNAKLVDFSRAEKDADPAPYPGFLKDPSWKPYLAFNAFFQVQSGQFKKLKIPYNMHYKFCENPNDEGYTTFDGDPENPKAKWVKKAVEFCERLNLVSEPIEWPKDGNILPELLSRALDNDITIKIAINKGYIDSIMASHREEVEEEDDTESKPTKKTSSKPEARPVKRVAKKDDDEEEL